MSLRAAAGSTGPAGAAGDGLVVAVPVAVDGDAAGGGEGDLPGVDGLPGAASLAGRGGELRGLPGDGADELDSGDPGGVLLADHARGQCDRKIGPVEGPAPQMADLASRSAVSDPSHYHLQAAASVPAG